MSSYPIPTVGYNSADIGINRVINFIANLGRLSHVPRITPQICFAFHVFIPLISGPGRRRQIPLRVKLRPFPSGVAPSLIPDPVSFINKRRWLPREETDIERTTSFVYTSGVAATMWIWRAESPPRMRAVSVWVTGWLGVTFSDVTLTGV